MSNFIKLTFFHRPTQSLLVKPKEIVAISNGGTHSQIFLSSGKDFVVKENTKEIEDLIGNS